MKFSTIARMMLMAPSAIAQDLLQENETGYPTAIFVGIRNDCNEFLYTNLVEQLTIALNGAHVQCFQTETTFTPVLAQGEDACNQVNNNPEFNNSPYINVVGVSQGGLVARYMTEDCNLRNGGSVAHLLTLGTPNMGITAIPSGGCQELNPWSWDLYCQLENLFMNGFAFTDTVKDGFAPSSYYRPPNDMSAYYNDSPFLAQENNEVNRGQ